MNLSRNRRKTRRRKGRSHYMVAGLRFTKMQGIGNDYVYVNGFEERVDNPGELAKRISDRHFGVGSDG